MSFGEAVGIATKQVSLTKAKARNVLFGFCGVRANGRQRPLHTGNFMWTKDLLSCELMFVCREGNILSVGICSCSSGMQ